MIIKFLENDGDLIEKNNDTIEPSVRRLSLFDTLSSENELSKETNTLDDKPEPTLDTSEGLQTDTTLNSEGKDETITSNEFNPEETDNSELDEEFNQETEEELLDIPTFLRRQAN